VSAQSRPRIFIVVPISGVKTLNKIKENADSYLKNCYEKGIAGKDSDFDAYEYIEQFGAAGIKKYFSFAEELVRTGARDKFLWWYSGLLEDLVHSGWKKEFTIEMCNCLSPKSPFIASFLRAACVRPSVLLFEQADLSDPNVIKTTLWTSSLEEGCYFDEKHASRVVNLIKTSFLGDDESLKKAAYDCAIALSLPELTTPLVQIILDKSQDLTAETDLQEAFKILLYSLWWPGPKWEPNIFALRNSIKVILDKLQNYPVTIYTAKRLELAIKRLFDNSENSRKTLTTNWALEENFSSPNTQAVIADAFNKDFSKLHRWIDRTIINGTFDGELSNMIRIAVNAGANKHYRVAMAGFLSEIEFYVHKQNPRGLRIDFDYFMYKFKQ
jgi:hypothetical protein